MRLFLIDDQVMFRQGIKSLLERAGSYLVSGESGTSETAINRIQDCGTDIVILDSNNKGSEPLPTQVSVLKRLFPSIRVLVLSGQVDPVSVRETIAAGADGFLPKSADCTELLRALAIIQDGGCFIHKDLLGCFVDEFRKTRREPPPEQNLSAREQQLIELVSEGMNNKEIAKALFVSRSTVKQSLRTLFRRFGVSDRTKLVVEAMNRGVLSSNPYRREFNAS